LIAVVQLAQKGVKVEVFLLVRFVLVLFRFCTADRCTRFLASSFHFFVAAPCAILLLFLVFEADLVGERSRCGFLVVWRTLDSFSIFPFILVEALWVFAHNG
jgi:hypothetical protein